MKVLKLFIILFAILIECFLSSIAEAGSISFCNDTYSATQIIIIPPTGGSNILDRSLKSSLCDLNFTVAILDNLHLEFDNIKEDLNIHDQYSIKFLKALHLVIKAEKRKTILIGASLGGVFASLAFSRNHSLFDDLIIGAVIVAAGGPLHEIVASSQLPKLKALFERRKRAGMVSQHADYSYLLMDSIELDNIKWSQPQYRSELLFIITMQDDVMPVLNQRKLLEAFGNPKHYALNMGHLMGISYAYIFMVSDISEFIEKTIRKY